MTKEEELEKINKEIKKAQIKLGDIDNAINRESLVIESKTKESSELVDKTQLIKDELIVLEENYAEEKQSLKVFKEDAKITKDKLNTEIKKLENELSSIGSALSSDITILESSKTSLKAEVDTLAIQLKNEKESYKKTITELDKEAEVKTYALQNLTAEFNAKSSNYAILETQLKDKYALKLSEYSELEDRLVTLNKNIDSKDKELSKLSSEILDIEKEKSNIEVNIKELSKIKDSLSSEITKFEEEKAQYVADKFALQRNKEDMDKREDFIKNKYQEAGVRYN